MNTPNKQEEITRLRDFGLIQFEKGKAQAISEFKEKLIKRIAPDKLHRKWNEDVLEIIEKTAQEITG